MTHATSAAPIPPLAAEDQQQLKILRAHRRATVASNPHACQPSQNTLTLRRRPQASAWPIRWRQPLGPGVSSLSKARPLHCGLPAIPWSVHSAWDPYPFILLNLLLSFQAAYTAPAIMMSQNRQSEMDRRHAESDYEINIKAELEIELLHEKIDLMKEQELLILTKAVRDLSTQLETLSQRFADK